MPKWLHNTLYILLLIVSMGCISQGIGWKSYKKADEN